MYTALYESLRSKSPRWKNEEEVRYNWTAELAKALNIEFNLERYREDLSYNNVIIEFKDKGLFRGSDTSAKFLEAKDDRLKKYITRAADREGRSANEYIGIGIDGDHTFFAQLVDGKMVHGHLLPFSEVSVSMVADALKNQYRRAVTTENLVEDFGLGSAVGTAIMRALASEVTSKMNDPGPSKIKMLFEEWQALYGQIADINPEVVAKIRRTVGFNVNTAPEHRVPVTLFIIHTYNSLLIKVLAAEIMASHGLTSYSFFSQKALSYDDDTLIEVMGSDIEDGQLFSKAGVAGFVEEAIFSWYLDACKSSDFKKAFIPALRLAFARLALYRTDTLETAKSKDVLKQLYQNLVPEALRKSLGEFYTPGWLVGVSLDKVQPKTWVNVRVLDPTCGSGTFLLEAIKRKRIAGEVARLNNTEILDDVTKNIWGFDLNPLAVQTARLNFLIAISDLLKNDPGYEVELPILLADAVYSPANNPDNDEESVRYRIGSQVADLEIVLPSELALNRKRLDDVFTILGKYVDEDQEFIEVAKALVKSRALTSEELTKWHSQLEGTYNRVLSLHRRQWNGIWFRIVRNFFWSATAEAFDIVAGNPPWVRWSKLPSLYRERVKATCEQYDIFSSTPFSGGNELDISGLITYTVADKWLKPEGLMVFVIPQNHFQVPSSEGFRKFRIDKRFNLVPLQVDDLKSLKPFTGTTNRTAVVVFKKTEYQAVSYPIRYNVWDTNHTFSRTIPETLTQEQVRARTHITNMEATPVGGEGSPWAVLPPGRFEMLEHLQGECDWVQGRKGITADLNGLYFVNIVGENSGLRKVQIETRPEAGRTDIGPKQTFWIEPDLLYPLMKGASDFNACRITREHNLYVLVPNTGISKENYASSEESLIRNYPRTLSYFESFKPRLSLRSTYRTRMQPFGGRYFAIYNVGPYTFAPWKVFWAEQGKFQSAVVGMGTVPLQEDKPFVPDHKLFFADFQEPEPAFYLCGLLNAEGVKEYIESHTIAIQIGDVFKHMSLPKFDPGDAEHIKLSIAARHAHECPINDYEDALSEVRRLAEMILFSVAV